MERQVKPIVAELVGTFVFFFIGAGAIVTDSKYHNVGLIGIALAHGLALSIMISAFGATSGGHFNPAVTASFLVTRRIKIDTAIYYILAQLVGGTLAGLALRAVFPESIWRVTHLGSPALAPGVSVGTAIFLEAVLTFFLVLAVFGTAVDARAPKIGGFGIGLTVMMDILVGGPLTGAAMNPARAFGPQLASGFWSDWYVFWIGPVIGGVVAALLYDTVILGDDAQKA
ncbi:MAG TPA: MIP/aquaporin family protein [Chloroflexota bacterium]|nr:MIP/aquaporin family protein [Chloroflexota bacterium]